MSGTSLIVSDIFSILPIDTYIVKLIPIQRNSTRNSTDKASWGWGPNRENFRRNSTDKAGWGWIEDRGL